MKKIVLKRMYPFLFIGALFILFSCVEGTKIIKKDKLNTTNEDLKKYSKDQNGCLVWNPDANPNEKIEWSGACQSGYANGKGTLKLSTAKRAETYQDITLVHGKVEGFGIIDFSYPEKPCETCVLQFAGTFKNAIPLDGTLTLANGEKIDLPLIKDQNGCLIWFKNPQSVTKVSWSGGCKDGFANGKGTLKISNSKGAETYKGVTLKKGKIEGYGIVEVAYLEKPCKTCIMQFKGMFRNAVPINGVLTLANGNKLDLSFVEDQNGCLVWNPNPKPDEKIIWSGACENGYANGEGTLKYISNTVTETFEGTLNNGIINGYGTMKATYTEKPCETCITSFTGTFKNHTPTKGMVTLGNGEKRHFNRPTQADSQLEDEIYATITDAIVTQALHNHTNIMIDMMWDGMN